jgi:raffinose/stachyose/melibiose transport system permease protein
MATQKLSLPTIRNTRLPMNIPFRRLEYYHALLALIPALVLYLIFTYYPLFQSLLYAFTDWNGYSEKFNIVGLNNFGVVFTDPLNLQAFGNTFAFASLAIGIGFPLQLLLAILLHNKFRGSAVARAIIYIPSLFSPVIVSLAWTALLQYTGLINEALRAMGMGGSVVNWLGDVKVVMFSLVLVNTWQYTGLGMVIFLAGLASVPTEVTESAQLDGANGWTLFRNITFPLIMPAVTVNLLIAITGALKLFELPLIMTKGGPRGATTTVVMNIYNNAFGYERFGVSGSLGIVFFVIIAGFTLGQLAFTRSREVQY